MENVDGRRAHIRHRDFQRIYRVPVRVELVSQWHAVQAKDAMNAMGIGAFFVTTNFSQTLTLHVAFFPFLVIILVVIHLAFIRHESPVKPYP